MTGTKASASPRLGSARSTQPPPIAPDPIALEPGHEIGRFTVLSYLGAGAMGIVYAAYDPELDRKVALKVLRPAAAPDNHGRMRLHDEAQAMAKVSHPNVAVVHEIGLHDDGIFIAMEFVRGSTLAAWLTDRKSRPWHEILDAFMQAGRGLAAAHAAGLVHRDFKPSNAMIGEDGRVRVLDFGLSSAPAKAGREIVGTPAYMPPEQFLGHPIGPAADQFSFCASLYQALFGQLPFPGHSAEELRLTITSGAFRQPPRNIRVPSSLTAAIVRGLRQDPKDRFPSMEELLRQLDHRRNRGRRTLATAVACTAIVGVGGGWLSAQRSAANKCSGDAEQLADVWNDDARAAIARAFHELPPAFERDVLPRAEAVLQRYADDWADQRRTACETRRRGDYSEALRLSSEACFGRNKDALVEAVAVLKNADRTSAARALGLVDALPPSDRCTNITALQTGIDPPRGMPQILGHTQIQQSFERVRTADLAGDQRTALELSDQLIEEAEHLNYLPDLAEAYLLRGRLVLARQAAEAEDPLTRAFRLSLEARDDKRAAEALAIRMYARGRMHGRLDAAYDDYADAQALLARSGWPAHEHGLLLNNAGPMFLAAGDVERGQAVLADALQRRRATLGEDHIDVGYTLANLAMVTDDRAETEKLYNQALKIFEHRLGPAHPASIRVRIAASVSASDPLDAMQMIEESCIIADEYNPDDHIERARCLLHLFTHARDTDQDELARAAIFRARALVDATTRPIEAAASEIALIHGYAALVDDRPDEALARLNQQLAELGGDEWWQRHTRAELELCLGLNLLALKLIPQARDALARSVDDFSHSAVRSQALLPQVAALAELSLARALAADHEPAAAEAALDRAQSWYAAAGDSFAWRVRTIADARRSLSSVASAPTRAG